MSSFSTYDSFTRADGTRYVGRYKAGKNIIEKYDADGKRTVISSMDSGNSKSGNKQALAATFDSFKSGLEAAEGGEQLTYGEENVTAGGGGGLFGGGDKYSTLELSDGSILKSAAGKTANEVATVKRLADEIGAAYIEKEEVKKKKEVTTGTENTDTGRIDGADDIVEENVLDVTTNVEFGESKEAETAESNLEGVGIGSAGAFGGGLVGDPTQDTSSFTNSEAIEKSTEQTNEDLKTALAEVGDSNATSGTSILTSVPAAVQTVSSNTASGGQQEKEAAISVGPAEDDAIDFYTEGQRGTIMTRPGGLLTDPEDPALRRRRSLLAG